MLTENKFSKYLIYAIGEIVLVVIGILIALWINKWQEAVKIDENRLVIANQVYHQMVKDTANVASITKYHRETRYLYDKVLRETEPGEPIEGCFNCPWLLQGNLNIANTDNKVLNLLRNMNYDNDSLSNRLRRVEEDYNNELKILEMLEKRIVDNLATNYEELLDNEPWFTEYISKQNCNEDCRKYFNESQDFRRRIALVEMLVINAYNSELVLFNQRIDQHLAGLQSFVKAR